MTPVMFMDVIQSFGSLLDRKNNENETERKKYEMGVEKLVEAAEMVEEMKAYLDSLNPELIAKTKQVEETVKKLRIETEKIEVIKEKVD